MRISIGDAAGYRGGYRTRPIPADCALARRDCDLSYRLLNAAPTQKLRPARIGRSSRRRPDRDRGGDL
jgi:hypothetical protein